MTLLEMVVQLRDHRTQLEGFGDIVSWLNLPSADPYEPWHRIAPQWKFNRDMYPVDGKPNYVAF